MSEYAEAQQAAANGLNELGIQATLMVHYPSKINAPEGILLTTYDQLHSQIAKCETTAYAFPSFGAAQSVMRTLYSVQQTAVFIFECHANTGPAEIAAKIFDICNKYIPAIREIRQITEPIKYQKYPTVLYLVTMNYLNNNHPTIIWKVPDTISDELILPARIAYEIPDGKELRHGHFPGIMETSTAPNGCYNSDRSKGSIPLTIKYQQNSSLQKLKVREVIESLMKETSVLQDTQFQIKEGSDWHRLHKLKETDNFTVMSTRHLNDQERTSLASELMSYRIKFYFLSKVQIILKLEGIDIEVLRNLLHCTTTYLPFGQRQQSSQVSLSKIKVIKGKWYQMEVTFSPVGSMPLIPLQIAKSSVIDLIDEGEPMINTELGLSLASTFSATRFEFQTIVDDDNSNVAMITFWVPRDVNFSFPCNHTFTDNEGMKFSFTVEHCGCILPQTGAPGEPPRHETKGEHWRRVGEHLNPSYKNRLTVIAPASAQNSSQRRRFGLLKESHVDYLNQPVSYTYAEETYPWILFLNSLPESDYLDVFLTRFGQCETVKAEGGNYLQHSSQRLESLAKHTRIVLLQLPSGKQCQINRVEGTEGAPYLTKVDALHIYPFKDCQLMLIVPPLLDYRALLTSTTRLVVSKIWSYEPSNNTNVNSTPIKPTTPQASCAASQQRPTTRFRAPQSQGGATIKSSVLAEGCKDPPQSLPYNPPDVAAPPSPLPHDIQPYQSNPYPVSGSTNSECRDLPSCNKNLLPSQGDANDVAKTVREPGNHQSQRDIPKANPSVSPTMTWTNLPVSQPSRQPEMLGGDMAVDFVADPGNDNNEDSEMLPCKPDPPSTPECKGTQVSLNSISSQKDPLPTRKLGREEQLAGSPDKVNPGAGTPPPGQDGQLGNNLHPCPGCPPEVPSPPTPDPISPVSAPAERASRRLQPSPGDPMNNDPITATPPSQRKCHDDGVLPSPAAFRHEPALPEGRSRKEATDKMTDHSPSAPSRSITKPARSSAASNKGREPPIHAALKKSSTLSVNDNTEICIDITGDQEAIEQEGSIVGSSDGTGSNAAVPARFATLAPFLNASEKWFPNFDPNLQQLLAARAQQLAIHCKHFSSLNAALYLLSKGPWIQHTSVSMSDKPLWLQWELDGAGSIRSQLPSPSAILMPVYHLPP